MLRKKKSQACLQAEVWDEWGECEGWDSRTVLSFKKPEQLMFGFFTKGIPKYFLPYQGIRECTNIYCS